MAHTLDLFTAQKYAEVERQLFIRQQELLRWPEGECTADDEYALANHYGGSNVRVYGTSMRNLGPTWIVRGEELL